MNKQVFTNKRIRKEIRRNFYGAIVVNLALWDAKAGPSKMKTGGSWNVTFYQYALAFYHHGCL
jgi:hypothetical protein